MAVNDLNYGPAGSAAPLSRRAVCARAFGLAASLGALAFGAGALPAWADGAQGEQGAQAAAGGEAAGEGASQAVSSDHPAAQAAPSCEVADHVAVADGADDVPAGEVEVVFPLTLTDDQGRQVRVDSLDTVVVCMGSFAKTWQLAGGELAGVTDDALVDFDLDGVEHLMLVGDFTAPNLEQILALEPSLVIMSAVSAGKGGQSSQLDLVAPLEDAGIPVLTFKVTVFGDYLRMLRACCDLTGRYDLYRSHGLDTRDRIDEVLAAAGKARAESGAQAPTCLLMTTYSSGTRVLNSATQSGAILADLGGLNVADENSSLLKDFSLESVVALDPDYVFVLPMGNDAQAAQRALAQQTQGDPAWASLTAVQEGRYQALDPALFQYKPLDAWDEAYRAMAKALYGDDVCA